MGTPFNIKNEGGRHLKLLRISDKECSWLLMSGWERGFKVNWRNRTKNFLPSVPSTKITQDGFNTIAEYMTIGLFWALFDWHNLSSSKAALSFMGRPLTLWCQFSAESLCAGPVRPVSPEEFAFPLVKITFLQCRCGLIKVLCSPFLTAYWRHLDFHATGIRITGEEFGARRFSLWEPKAILTWLVEEEVSSIVSSRREGRTVPKSPPLLMATQTRIKGRIRTGRELWLPCLQVTVAFESREVNVT